MKKKILVCGGREYKNQEQFDRAMEYAMQWFDPYFCIIQGAGGARGADKKASFWCFIRGYPCMEVRALWNIYLNKAGPLRNKWMLDFGQPDLVIAFPGGPGTANMVKQSRERGIDVWEVPKDF